MSDPSPQDRPTSATSATPTLGLDAAVLLRVRASATAQALASRVPAAIQATATPDLSSPPPATTAPLVVWDSSPTALIVRYYSPHTTAGSVGAYDQRYYIPEVQIWGDGRILWVERPGTQRRVLQGQLTADQLRSLLQRFVDAGFFTWQARYESPGGNSTPFMHLQVSLGGYLKEVQEHGGAPPAFYGLVAALRTGAGAVGQPYLPLRGYLTAAYFPGASGAEWPAAAGFGLEAVGAGRYISGETLAFAWELVNQNPTSPVYVRSGDRTYVIMLQIPGVSYFEPPSATVDTPAIQAFSLDPPRVRAGQPVTLTWRSAGGQRALIYRLDAQGRLAEPQGIEVPLEGSWVTDPADELNRTYAFLLVIAAGEASASATLRAELICETAWFFPNPPAQCPQPARTVPQLVAQRFERGLLLWGQALRQPGVDEIVVLFDTGEWRLERDTWAVGLPESDPGLVPPAGLVQPVRGFGRLWREAYAAPGQLFRDRLGWAVEQEYGLGPGGFQCDTLSYSTCYVTGPAEQILALPYGFAGWRAWNGP